MVILGKRRWASEKVWGRWRVHSQPKKEGEKVRARGERDVDRTMLMVKEGCQRCNNWVGIGLLRSEVWCLDRGGHELWQAIEDFKVIRPLHYRVGATQAIGEKKKPTVDALRQTPLFNVLGGTRCHVIRYPVEWGAPFPPSTVLARVTVQLAGCSNTLAQYLLAGCLVDQLLVYSTLIEQQQAR